jgi:hypothetical protein
MKRHVWQFFTAASLLLCLATAAMWVRSYLCYDHVEFYCDSPSPTAYGRQLWDIESMHGGVELRKTSVLAKDAGMSEELRSYTDTHRRLEYKHFGLDEAKYFKTYLARPDEPHLFGCQAGSEVRDGKRRFLSRLYLDVPWWLLFVLTSLPWMFWISARQRRRRRLGRHLCDECGYDLRATPDRCPECGTARAAE